MQQHPPAPPPAAAAAPVAVPVTAAPNGGIQLGGVNLKFGGFIEAAGIYRSRNEVADVASDFNTGLNFKNIVQTHEQEFRGSARQTRVTGLVTGDVDAYTHLGGYIESDFLSSGTNSNSRESNSYVPRLRVGYATVDLDTIGFHFLAGQEWSLLTTNTNGIMPRQEQIPLTIDAQYVPGFNWTRNPQARFVENFAPGLWAGLSFESPQGVASPGITANGNGTAAGTPNVNNNGDSAGLLNNTTQYTNDIAPDIVGKIAVDPGFGHYELKGIGRIFTARDLGTTHAVWGYGIGGAAIVPILPKLLDFQASGLAGYGIGRYGSGQLPDFALARNGVSIVPVPVFQALTGLVAHLPTPTATDVYSLCRLGACRPCARGLAIRRRLWLRRLEQHRLQHRRRGGRDLPGADQRHPPAHRRFLARHVQRSLRARRGRRPGLLHAAHRLQRRGRRARCRGRHRHGVLPLLPVLNASPRRTCGGPPRRRQEHPERLAKPQPILYLLPPLLP
jgi:hypothetical protein